MLRRTTFRCQAVPRSGGAHRSPYAILGVSHRSTKDEVKKKYKQLARTYHPDMPNGSSKKFKELTAAYTIVKLEIERAERMKTGEPEPGEKYNYAKAAPDTDQEEDVFKKAAKEQQQAAGVKQKTWSAWDLWLTTDVLEYVASLLAVVMVACYLFNRRLTWLEDVKTSHYGKLQELEKLKYTPVAQVPNDGKKKHWRREEHENTAVEHHDSLASFMMTAEPDTVAKGRKVATRETGKDLIVEELLQDKCVHVFHVNTKGGLGIYKNALPGLTQKVMETQWEHVDQGVATALAMQGAAVVPFVSPSTHRITTFEYVHRDDNFPRCGAVVLNHKYEETKGNAQRIVMMGDDALQPTLAKDRLKDLETGAVLAKNLVTGGILPTKETKIYHDHQLGDINNQFRWSW